jgi:hypothetical protein
VLACEHDESAQQGCPADMPHTWQTYDPEAYWQRVLAAVQVVLLQQGCPAPPQVPQAPAWQVPAEVIPQLAPAATQRLLTQQPPDAQAFP